MKNLAFKVRVFVFQRIFEVWVTQRNSRHFRKGTKILILPMGRKKASTIMRFGKLIISNKIVDA